MTNSQECYDRRELEPEDTSCDLMQADLAFQFGDFEQAIDYYNEVIRNGADGPSLYLKRGKAKAARGDGEGAL